MTGRSSNIIRQALERTTEKRGSINVIAQHLEILKDILASEPIRSFLEKYQKAFEYASDIIFDDICGTINEIMTIINSKKSEK